MKFLLVLALVHLACAYTPCWFGELEVLADIDFCDTLALANLQYGSGVRWMDMYPHMYPLRNVFTHRNPSCPVYDRDNGYLVPFNVSCGFYPTNLARTYKHTLTEFNCHELILDETSMQTWQEYVDVAIGKKLPTDNAFRLFMQMVEINSDREVEQQEMFRNNLADLLREADRIYKGI